MKPQKIEPHKITKPIQLMAVWFLALFAIDYVFIMAATNFTTPSWIAPSLVISAIVFVPLFLVGVFLMQTVFRRELQEDQYYSEYLKRQEETFKNFKPENSEHISVKEHVKLEIVDANNDIEKQRIEKYEKQKGLFLVHEWRPSIIQNQIADIVIWLYQHGEGPLSQGKVEKVEYQLGPKFFDKPQIKKNGKENFKIEVSAYGPMLCLARVFLKGQEEAIILERYINFDS